MNAEILHVSFRLMTEKTFSHSMDASLLISDVKAIIETDSEIAPENQRLIFKGQLLRDDCSLKSYGVESGSTIHVVGRTGNAAPNAEGCQTCEHCGNVDSGGASPTGADGGHEGHGNPPQGVPLGPGGVPMGFFMSPIYATISLSRPGNNINRNREASGQQGPSQLFAGVMHSFLNAMHPMPNRNGPQPEQQAPAETTNEATLVTELEASTATLNRVSSSVKALNSPEQARNGLWNPTPMVTRNGETITVEFRNMGSSSESLQPSSTEMERESEEAEYAEASEGESKYESFETDCSRSGKVLLMDPEVLTSKLPWEDLEKLERLLTDTADDASHAPRCAANKDFALRSPSANLAENLSHDEYTHDDLSTGLPTGTRTPTNSMEGADAGAGAATGDSGTYSDFLSRFQAANRAIREAMGEYDLGDRAEQLARFNRLSNALAVKTRIDAALCAVFAWMETNLAAPAKARAFATNMGWNAAAEAAGAAERTRGPEFSAESAEAPSGASAENHPAEHGPTDQSQLSEMDLDQTSVANSQAHEPRTVSSQTDLFERYRTNPEFEASMERVRQTKLSDSYHNS